MASFVASANPFISWSGNPPIRGRQERNRRRPKATVLLLVLPSLVASVLLFQGRASAATLGASGIARYARSAGFRGDALVTSIAVALAESGGDTDAVGDVDLVDDEWGPSVGLWQIRSKNAQRGQGTTRDYESLFDPSFNANSAYTISSGGSNWGPWTMYTNGGYRRYLGQAEEAAGSSAPDEDESQDQSDE